LPYSRARDCSEKPGANFEAKRKMSEDLQRKAQCPECVNFSGEGQAAKNFYKKIV